MRRNSSTAAIKPLGPGQIGWQEQREQEAVGTFATHHPPEGVCRVCLHTHRASFYHIQRETQQHLIQKLILARLVAQNLVHVHALLGGCFKQLQDVVPSPVPDRRRMLFGGKKRNVCKAGKKK